MPPRLVAILVWCALVLVGVIVIVWRPEFSAKPPDQSVKTGPVATRLLPKNTLLLPSELTNPNLTGRYIVAPDGVKQGVAVRPEDVADQPILVEAPPVRLLLSLPLPRTAVIGGFNAGSKVQLCGKAPVAFGPVVIQAVRCDLGSPAPNCSAIVELPSSAAGDVAAKGLKDQTSMSELRLSATCD